MSLSSLPVELLLQIAGHLSPTDPHADTNIPQEDHNRELRSLASTSQKLRPVAQEVLQTSCHVQKANYASLVQTVLKRPDLAKHVQEIIFDEGNPFTYGIGFDRRRDIAAWTAAIRESYGYASRDLIARLQSSTMTNLPLARDATRDVNAPSGPYFAALALLVARLPALTRIYIRYSQDKDSLVEFEELNYCGKLQPNICRLLFKQMNRMYINPVSHLLRIFPREPLNAPEWLVKMRSILHDKIKEISIHTSSVACPAGIAWSDSFVEFHALKRLRVEAYDLAWSSLPLIPRGIEHLVCQFGYRDGYPRLQEGYDTHQLSRLNNLIEHADKFSDLKTVEARYHHPLSSMLDVIVFCHGFNLAQGKIDLRRWASSKVRVIFSTVEAANGQVWTSDSQEFLDMIDRLQGLVGLSEEANM